jgi:hypothetical protein
MTRRTLSFGILLAGAALLVTVAALSNSVSGWISPPAAAAAPSFRYLIAPMNPASSTVDQRECRRYAEELQAKLEGRLFSDVSNDEYSKCRPDRNTEVVEMTEVFAVKAGLDIRQLVLSVNSKTAQGGHSREITQFSCPAEAELRRCVPGAVEKFSAALAVHRDDCHLPGKEKACD